MGAVDIVPELLKLIEQEFFLKYSESKTIKEAIKILESKKATYINSNDYAVEVGRILANTFQNNISSDILPNGKMYYNIAERILNPTMINNYNLVSNYATEVQKELNHNARLIIKAQRAPLNQDRIDGLINRISSEESYDKVSWLLKEPIVNFSQSIVDDTAKENITFHAQAGLKPKIIRRSVGNCCDWCSKLAGEYSYPEVPKDVYRRHKNCRCIVEYYPGDGKRQNVHSKKWTDPDKEDKINIRKAIGLYEKITTDNGLAGKIINRPSMLNTYKPKELKLELEKAGYEVKPLGRGNYKNISFEQGGGYRVNFGGDSIIQYHPEKRSRHGSEYYKIGNGKIGIKRYNMKGEEIID